MSRARFGCNVCGETVDGNHADPRRHICRGPPQAPPVQTRRPPQVIRPAGGSRAAFAKTSKAASHAKYAKAKSHSANAAGEIFGGAVVEQRVVDAGGAVVEQRAVDAGTSPVGSGPTTGGGGAFSEE